MGVSNVSFGLPREGRRILNAAYLHHAVSRGLDMAIINPAELLDYKSIPKKDRKIAEDLVLNKRKDALERFVKHFSGKVEEHIRCEAKELPIEQRLRNSVVDRDKAGIIKLVDEALGKYKAEEIINGILLEAMREVGEKLDSGEFVLPYVLQSAEVMRAAIEHLKKFLPKGTDHRRGKVLLATVFGDVHDIGKNLVKMILKNNGFAVIDLGKQVPVGTILREAKKNKVDAVGLSALLVSTAMHMKTCVQAFHDAGCHYPVIIGGAPINDLFAAEVSRLEDGSIYKGGVFYAKDAFTALRLTQALLGGASEKKKLMDRYREQVTKNERRETRDERRETRDAHRAPHTAHRKVPVPPFHGVRSISNIPVDDVFGYLDQKALFARSWGSKIKDEKKRSELVKKEYAPLLRELKEECVRKGWLELKAVYGYFKCSVSGNEMKVFGNNGEILEDFSFEPLKGQDGLSPAKYFKGEDLVAFQAVTVGGRISAAIKELEERDEYARVLYLHGLSVHLAEALASYIHDRIRKELDLKPGQGKRYSPGYPLWKNLADQKKIFKILDVEKRIGVTLTEAFQMVPEQSTTAMIVYDERAQY